MSTKQNKVSVMDQYKLVKDAGATELSYKDWKFQQHELSEAAKLSVVEVVEMVESAIELTEAASIAVEAVLTKRELSRAIFREELDSGTLVRKNVMKRFKAEVNMTEAGSNTYYQDFRVEFGLVVKKESVV